LIAEDARSGPVFLSRLFNEKQIAEAYCSYNNGTLLLFVNKIPICNKILSRAMFKIAFL
jgi:hypothetical protein